MDAAVPERAGVGRVRVAPRPRPNYARAPMQQRTASTASPCPIAAALEAVGEWWSLLVVREAFRGAQRFDALQARLGIARNILARRLKALVEHGVLERRPYQDHPPRFEYALTEKGRALYPVLVTLFAWGRRWAPGAGPAALVEIASGRTLEPVLVDRASGAPIEPGTARIQRLADAAPPRPPAPAPAPAPASPARPARTPRRRRSRDG